MNLTMVRRAGSSAVVDLAALIVLTSGFGCGSDRVRPAEECVLRANPVVFGDVAVGDTLVLDATVINTGRNPLDLIATLDSPDFRLAAGDSVPVALAARGTTCLAVAYAPQTVGPKTAEITFSDMACPTVEMTGGTPKAIPGYVKTLPFRGALVGVAVGADGTVYADFYSAQERYGYAAVDAYTAEGTRIKMWPDTVDGPDGLAPWSGGGVLVVDAFKGTVSRLALAGGEPELVGISPFSPGRFRSTNCVAVDEGGFIYVSDQRAGRVQKFSPGGEYVESWWMHGPYDVHADRAGRVIVCGSEPSGDATITSHPYLKICSTSGEVLYERQSISTSYMGSTTNGDRYLYVAVTPYVAGGSYAIMKAGLDGHLVSTFAVGHYYLDIAADSSGFLYAVTRDSLYKFTTAGDSVAVWPNGGVGVAFDGTAGLYVLKGDRVTHVSVDGVVIGEWGETGDGDGQFKGATGIAVAPDGTVFVADKNHARVQELDSEGTFLAKFGNVPDEPGWLHAPVDVAVSQDGTIYVATTGDNQIEKFAPDGSFVTSWGGLGQNPGQFDSPRGVAVSGSGEVYVWDTGNHRVQVFDPDGAFIRAWEPADATGAVEPWPVVGYLPRSAGIAVSADDVVYLPDRAGNRVVAFASDGTPLGSWGGYGTGPGRFIWPRDVAVGSDGRIYVADYGNQRMQVFQLQSP